MVPKTLTLVTLVSLATAETSVVSLFLPDTDPQPLVGSIVKEGGGTTTYSIVCAPDTDSSDCGMGPGLLFTAGPSTVEWAWTESAAAFTGRVVCSMGGTTTAVCTETFQGAGANAPGRVTTALDQADITSLPVTITAGPSTGATGASPGAPGSTTTDSTGVGNTSSSTESSGNSASATSDASSLTSTSSTAGLPQVTGSSGWALGAAVALVAVAL